MHDTAPYVTRLIATAETIYLAGHFTIVGGVDREGLAEVDRISGLPTTWDPLPGPRVRDTAPYITGLALGEGTIFVAGGFFEIGGERRYAVAEIDRTTGESTAWDPRVDVAPEVLIPDGDRIHLGGSIGMVGCVERTHLAAFDATSGKPTAWNPNPNGFFMTDVAAHGDRVYLAGDFTLAGGQVRRGLAAVDTVTGQALDWRADVDDGVRRLDVIGDRLFAVGAFRQIGGVPRRSLAAFNLRTGELDPLDLLLNDDAFRVCALGNTLYLTGYFSSVAGQDRRWVAAVDLETGSIRDWYPKTDFVVSALAVYDTTVFLGGAFQEVDGLPRGRLAAVSATTGAVRSDWVADAFDPLPPARVYDLVVLGSTLYAAGDFDTLGGEVRGGLAALDARTGEVLPWDPKLIGASVAEPPPSAIVWSLETHGSTIYAGGLFLWTDQLPMSTLAAISAVAGPVDPPVPLPSVIELSPPFPNPVREGTTLRFALPTSAVVDLAVFDVRGRRVESVLPGVFREAGIHEIPLRTAGWPAGFYYCRLQVGESREAKKFVVLQ